MAFTIALVAALSFTRVTAGAGHTVQARNFQFVAPGGGSTLTIAVGDTVTWVASGDPHTVTSGAPGAIDGRFVDHPASAGLLLDGDTFTTTFPSSGTFPYFCEIHPEQMSGRIVVGAPATPNSTPKPTPKSTPKPTPKPPAPPTPAPTTPPTIDPTSTPVATSSGAAESQGAVSAPPPSSSPDASLPAPNETTATGSRPSTGAQPTAADPAEPDPAAGAGPVAAGLLIIAAITAIAGVAARRVTRRGREIP